MDLIGWLKERELNCRRLACEAGRGEFRDAWEADAAWFELAIAAVQDRDSMMARLDKAMHEATEEADTKQIPGERMTDDWRNGFKTGMQCMGSIVQAAMRRRGA